jgi:carboxyl-terminal processing protease
MGFYKIRFLSLCALLASVLIADADVKPQDYYGRIAQRVGRMLPTAHVLQSQLDDTISQKAWTNLFTQYDYNRMVFLQSDLDKFEHMKKNIDDAIRQGDVSFVYDVHKMFVQRYTDRVAFVTNLLQTSEFDFTKDEDFMWRRKDATWPTTLEEQNELWRKMIKNEYLLIVLGRELAEERKEKEALNKKKSKKKSEDKKDEAEETKEPELTPKEILLKRYKMYLAVRTEADEEAVLQRYLSAVAQSYDPHSDYMSPMRKEDFDMDMNLSLCGVGAVLRMEDDGSLGIAEVMPGGPVSRDGRIKKGDKIVGVGQGDGPIEDIMFKPMKKTIKKIRGKKDTKVVLEIIPKSDPSGVTRRKIALIRDEIKLEDQAATGTVEKVVLNGVTNRIGYVKLPGFYGTMDKAPNDPNFRSCALDVASYVAKFNEERTDGMILDLRGNGGGSLREAVLLSAIFLKPSPVVQISDTRQVGVLRTFDDAPMFAYRKPLVVMIDRASASASEIVAGVLQDTGRAVVVGDTRSHGKGTVQTVMPVGPEKYGSMKITTARFYRINGSSTQVKGIESDIRLPSWLDGIGEIGEDKLPGALPWTEIQPIDYNIQWNMAMLIPSLKEASDLRILNDEKFDRHLKAVKFFKESADRKTVSLERNKRKKQMVEDRKNREEIDPDEEDDDYKEDDDAISAYVKADKGLELEKDAVLKETLNIVSDIVRLTNGEEIPQPAPQKRLPAWLRMLGNE